MTIQMKAIKQYFHVAVVYHAVKVAVKVAIKSVDETLVWDYLHESLRAVLSSSAVQVSFFFAETKAKTTG